MQKSLLAKTKAKKSETRMTASILNKIQTHMVKLKENAIY